MRNTLAVVLTTVIALFSWSAAQAQSTWDTIHQSKELRVGVASEPPWFFKDLKTGTWSGVGISMGQAMADTLGVKMTPVEVTVGTAIAALQANKIDVMFVLDATPARALSVDFPAQPMLYYALAALVHDDMKVVNWTDLDKPSVTIAVTQGTSMDAFDTAHLPHANIERFPTNGDAVAAFQSGRANAVSLFEPALLALQKQLGQGTIVIPKPIRSSTSSAAVRRETDKTWRDWVGTCLSYYYETGETEGWFETALRDYGIDPTKVPGIVKERW